MLRGAIALDDAGRDRLWDSQIVEQKGLTEEWVRDLDALSTPDKAAGWTKGAPEDWASESLEAARLAYCLPGTKTGTRSGIGLGNGYCQSTLRIAQRQLAKAGVRIATVLNEIFK
jgi:hypothetical protein